MSIVAQVADAGEPNAGHLGKVVGEVKLREVWTDMAEILIRNVSTYRLSTALKFFFIQFCCRVSIIDFFFNRRSISLHENCSTKHIVWPW